MQQALLVEDQHDSRIWLRGVLDLAYPDIQVSEAGSLKQAREELNRIEPEIALVDLGLPDGSGAELIAEVVERVPSCLCIVTTIYADDAHLFPALHAGARGYLLKEQTQRQLVRLLHRIADGEPPLSPAIAQRLLQLFSPVTVADAREQDDLTPREREVLVLIAKGYKLASVAEALELSHYTVEGYVKDIYRKLRVSSRAEAALEAARRGLVQPYL